MIKGIVVLYFTWCKFIDNCSSHLIAFNLLLPKHPYFKAGMVLPFSFPKIVLSFSFYQVLVTHLHDPEINNQV